MKPTRVILFLSLLCVSACSSNGTCIDSDGSSCQDLGKSSCVPAGSYVFTAGSTCKEMGYTVKKPGSVAYTKP